MKIFKSKSESQMQTYSDPSFVKDSKYKGKIFYRHFLQVELSNVVWRVDSYYLQLMLISPVIKMLYFQNSKLQHSVEK